VFEPRLSGLGCLADLRWMNGTLGRYLSEM
jgi:hypothetical protein